MFKSKFITHLIFFGLIWLHLIAAIWVQEISFYWLIIAVIIYLALLMRGVFDLRNNYFLKSQHRLQGFKLNVDNGAIQYHGLKEIALTFDDGPHPTFTPVVLSILRKHQAKATFFIIGNNIDKNAPIIQQIIDEGHTLGIHSWYHKNTDPFKPTKVLEKEYQQIQNYLQKQFNYTTHLIRPSFGITNPRIAKAIENLSLNSIGWSLRSLDTKAKTKEQIIAKIKKKLKPNQIVLLHDTLPQTVEALDEILEYIHSKDWKPVALEKYNI